MTDSAISKNDLAAKAGVSRSQVYDVLARKKAATLDWIGKVAAVLEVTPDSLLKAA